jgi:predicted metal-dependent phosphoesterase TrpH
MDFCDLHTHSTASDGSIPPDELPRLARKIGLKAIALTDHDTTRGLPDCAAAARKARISFVPGIEVSADPAPAAGKLQAGQQLGTLHILGLFIAHDDPLLADIEQRMRSARDSRNPAIVRNLQELGVKIDYSEVLDLATEQGTRIVGRPHIAQVLMKKGYVRSIADAFARYIGQGAPAYVRRDRLHPQEAIDAIHHAGGLAILAHPVQLGLPGYPQIDHFATQLQKLGLDGIETRHPDHTAADTKAFEGIAEKLGLLVAGGSDFHGERKPISLGSQNVPVEVFEALKQAAADRRGSRQKATS